MINLQIVTPERKVIDEQVDSVNVPTGNGEIGILGKHAPLISTLKPGILKYSKGGNSEELIVSGGFVEVSDDRVSILADIAESSEDVDIEAAKLEREEATKILGDWKGSEEEFEIELEKLQKAQARLQLGSKR
ncbi:MAG: F0F1 ATP synthase subunit epsilon [Pyrinomonadaceae bacterium]